MTNVDVQIQWKHLDVFKSTDIFVSSIIYFAVLKTEKIKTKIFLKIYLYHYKLSAKFESGIVLFWWK